MLTQTKQVVMANQLTYLFERLEVINMQQKELRQPMIAKVYFIVRNEKGEDVGREVLDYGDAEFDRFALNFNSWTWLYTELAKKLEIPAPTDDQFEDQFIKE